MPVYNYIYYIRPEKKKYFIKYSGFFSDELNLLLDIQYNRVILYGDSKNNIKKGINTCNYFNNNYTE